MPLYTCSDDCQVLKELLWKRKGQGREPEAEPLAFKIKENWICVTSQVNHPADGDSPPDFEREQPLCSPPGLFFPALPDRGTDRPALDWGTWTCTYRLSVASGYRVKQDGETDGWLTGSGGQHDPLCWASPAGPPECSGSAAGRRTRRHLQWGSAARRAATGPVHRSRSHTAGPRPAAPRPLWFPHQWLCSKKNEARTEWKCILRLYI